MTLPTLTNPTGRNTRAHIMTVGERVFYFSYETCIAYAGPAPCGEWVNVRVANSWGPTTGRHFKEMHCDGFETLSDEDFAAVAIVESVAA